MKLLQLLFLLGAAVFSSQDHLPVCQPPTPPSSESHRETLMVFVLDTTIWKEDKKYHWYFLKRLACSVPVSPSIQTFVVDCSANNTNLVISKDTVYDSNALMSKLYNDYEKRMDDTGRCAHFETTVKALLATPYIKDHPNLHMIVPTLDPTCKLPDFATTRKISIDFLDNKDGTRRFLTIGGEGIINADESAAPVQLTKATAALVSKMLTPPAHSIVAAFSTTPEKKPQLDNATIAAAIGCCLAAILAIIFIVSLVVCRKLKKSVKRQRKMLKAKKEAKKGGGEQKPKVPARRVIFKYGQTKRQYDDWVFYSPLKKLPPIEKELQAAMHKKYGAPDAQPPTRFPPPLHSNY